MPHSIQPLRIHKNKATSPPTKMNGPQPRALAELSPMERRRNSPSFVQNAKKAIFAAEPSTFDTSPFVSSSPRLYWQSRDPASPSRLKRENRSPAEQRDSSPSMVKRSSIENLKRASRVKNSNMFAREHKQEYDPSASPLIERPLATGRPLSLQTQGNAYGGRGLDGLRKENLFDNSKIPVYSPPRSSRKPDGVSEIYDTLSKPQLSPTKSSLSSKSRYAQGSVPDPNMGNWSEDEDSMGDQELPPGRALHRHAKSVTFDAAPPQINEYEMTTPDPSSVASGSREGSYESVDNDDDDSFDRGSSMEREDSFDESLEDTDKTPVVLPEDWRFMSPATASDELAIDIENPFDDNESSPAPTARPSSAVGARLSPTRSDSANSNGERRPLPPLPGPETTEFCQPQSESANGLAATAERVSSAQRTKPSPIRPASISKSEIQDMGGCSLSLEDRLHLMMIQGEEKPDSRGEVPHHRDSQEIKPSQQARTERKSKESLFKIHEDSGSEPDGYQLPPRISRESIIRKVKSRAKLLSEHDYEDLSPAQSSHSGLARLSDLDPDIPIQSLEVEPFPDNDEDRLVIKQEDDGEESEADLYSIPMYSQQEQTASYPFAWGSSSHPDILTPGGSGREGDLNTIEQHETFEETSRGSSQDVDDDESHYSDGEKQHSFEQHSFVPQSFMEDEGPLTPKARQENDQNEQTQLTNNNSVSLPKFSSVLGGQDCGFGLETFMNPSQISNGEPVKSSQSSALAQIDTSLERPVTPEAQTSSGSFQRNFDESDDESRTPDSVIRHSIIDMALSESPSVPEPMATIKAPGGKLKTRPSVTPADVQTMAETRRQVSQETPPVPCIPEKHQNRPSMIFESETCIPDQGILPNMEDESADINSTDQAMRTSSLVQLEVPVGKGDDCLGLGLDREFDRVIEAQKVAFPFYSLNLRLPSNSINNAEYIREQGFPPLQSFANRPTCTQKGYLMRQNTKIVIATSALDDAESDLVDSKTMGGRGTRSAGSSPIKSSQVHPWTTEPWNGRVRRKSLRQSGNSPQKKPSLGAAPPLPGQQSNVASGLDSVAEDQVSLHSEEGDEGGERGILFVKVIRVKDLDLPLPKGERSYFALTLDNGLHCVTTAWLELGKTAPIGQEFELIVLNDLEFQLTLQTKLVEPKPAPIVESPTKEVKVPKPSTFSRVFASPRKRKELEIKQEEALKAERQRHQDAQQASKRSAQPTTWELLNGLVAKDGSFARSYVCLKDHESRAYGRPLTVDVPCFNEWATEEAQTTSSSKSKRSNPRPGLQRRAPYKIGKLELQLLFVPKPKGIKGEEMPKSMNACIRELKEAETATTKKWEGHLSQQGGDCPYWRRRWFTLEGSKFTAHHESTLQPRATIHLAGASKLIDDKSALMRKETSSKAGGRRKSAFAEEEEGYMFVEEGFRIRFSNGETIDFYADSADEKEGWMKALAEVVGKDSAKGKRWTDLVLSKHRAIASKSALPAPAHMKAPHLRSAPQTPAGHRTSLNLPSQPEREFRPAVPGSRRADAAAKTRSMIF